jgi:drug/metabolite transporter (DMT)-like permease
VTLGIVHTGLMYVLLYGAIQKLPTALTGALSFIYPIAAIFVDWFAFGHRLQPCNGSAWRRFCWRPPGCSRAGA